MNLFSSSNYNVLSSVHVCVCVWVCVCVCGGGGGGVTDHILQAVSATGDLALLTLRLLQVASNPSFFY